MYIHHILRRIATATTTTTTTSCCCCCYYYTTTTTITANYYYGTWLRYRGYTTGGGRRTRTSEHISVNVSLQSTQNALLAYSPPCFMTLHFRYSLISPETNPPTSWISDTNKKLVANILPTHPRRTRRTKTDLAAKTLPTSSGLARSNCRIVPGPKQAKRQWFGSWCESKTTVHHTLKSFIYCDCKHVHVLLQWLLVHRWHALCVYAYCASEMEGVNKLDLEDCRTRTNKGLISRHYLESRNATNFYVLVTQPFGIAKFERAKTLMLQAMHHLGPKISAK